MPNKNWKIATFALGIITFSIVSYGIYKFAFNDISLSIKAAIVYKFGGAQAVSRTTFYLTKMDLESAAAKAGIQTNTSAASLWAFEENMNAQLGNKGTSRFVEALKPYVVSTVITDFNGEAKFEAVPSGKYFIIGTTPTRSGMAVWNLPITADKTQTIILDQNNAISAD